MSREGAPAEGILQVLLQPLILCLRRIFECHQPGGSTGFFNTRRPLCVRRRRFPCLSQRLPLADTVYLNRF